MSNMFKRFLSVALLLSWMSFMLPDDCDTCQECPKGCVQSQNLWQPHAFGVSMGREMTIKQAMYRKDWNEGWFGTFAVAPEYDRTMGPKCGKVCCDKLGSLPFWSSEKTNVMTIGDNSGDYDFDLYQIGLGPVTTSGTLTLNPRVYQAGADFHFYLGAHQVDRGFFFHIHGPVGLTSVFTRLGVDGEIVPVDYPAGALSIAATAVVPPYATVKEALAGRKDGGAFLKGMEYGLFSSCANTSSAKFGDLEVSIGYNMFADENKHFGLALRFSAPTGNKAQSIYVLEPIFGRNGHWGLGVEALGHWTCWGSNSSDTAISLWIDGYAMHLFKSKHMRTFDLTDNGEGSKYLLLAKYTDTVFQNEIINAVNITTLGIQSSFAVEGDFAVGLDVTYKSWTLGFGYEGWGRSCERLDFDCRCESIDLSSYAILGRQTPYNGVTPINLCQPTAKIGLSEDQSLVATSTILDATNVANRLPADGTSVLNVNAQRAAAVYTSKPYISLTHTWKDSSYAPYVGLKGGVELSHGPSRNSAANFWHLGGQAGLTF